MRAKSKRERVDPGVERHSNFNPYGGISSPGIIGIEELRKIVLQQATDDEPTAWQNEFLKRMERLEKEAAEILKNLKEKIR